jgi:hypothetical protein
LIAAISFAVSTSAFAANTASGKVAFKGHSSVIAYGWLVRGPDEADSGKTVLRVYLSSQDIGGKIEACRTLSCADEALYDGAMLDFGDVPHLGYAIRVNRELDQYSGGTDAGAFALSTNKPDHLAGKVHIDDTAFGGGSVDATFDLTLTRTFKALR